MKILITVVAGFIGFLLAKALLKKKGCELLGIDNLNNFYDIKLKNRLDQLLLEGIKFYKEDISNYKRLEEIFVKFKPDIVINLAAQAGVRYSISNPKIFKKNIVGFFNVIECCRSSKCRKLIYASSSSVYGNNKNQKFSEKDSVTKPLNLYVAQKYLMNY